jgi:exodeoxyribonuclease V beta subunit
VKPYLALKASAGSGKTFALTVRYISLLLLDAKPSQILTLTFTNKAATQMEQRIYDTLLSLGDDSSILEAIKEQTALDTKQILEKKDQIISIYIKSELAIYTIDKFTNKILREFSGYIGINDDFNISFLDLELLLYKFLQSLDEKQFDLLISFAYKENKKLNSIIELFSILQEKNEKLKTTNFTYEQYEAVKVAILEDANIIKDFIDKSAVSKSGYNAVDFSTIDQLLDKGKTWLTKDSLGEFTYFKKAKPPLELDENLTNLKKNIMLYYQIQESFTLKNLFLLFDNFSLFRNKFNKQKNSLEFSDITNIVYKLLSTHIQRDFLYFRLDTKYNHILIDEFQDTSIMQFKILDYLIEELISGDPEQFKTFFYVGDVKQSIYRFRGGKKELFDYVAQKYSPLLEVQLLDTNYRSGKNVVKFVNDKFLALSNYDYDKQYVKSNIDGIVKTIQISQEKEDIYNTIFLKVNKLLNSGVSANDIAILTYTNSDVLEIYEYLKSNLKNVQITTEMTSRLVNQQNVKAVINGIKYLYFKEDIYKTNFNSLVGFDYFDDFEFFIDIKSNDITTIIKKLSYFYNIVDDNILKLIEIGSKYDTIVDFIYEIDKDDTVMVSGATCGLSILTIFKSKGLEFDTVLVVDRITKKNYDKSSLLFEYDNIELKRIYYKRAKRENLDPYYNNALLKEKELSLADELNILYVALTRAKYNMFIFKKIKNSVFDLLGDFDTAPLGSLHIQSSNNTVVNMPEAKYKPLNLGYQDKTSQETKDDNLEARTFGIATHYILEMMKEFDQDNLNTAFALAKNKYSNILRDDNFDDIKTRINNLIANSQFLDLINNTTLYKEQSVIYKGEQKTIDLLIQKENSWIIIDYKTTYEKSVAHINQVQYYKNATKEITKCNDVTGYIIYLKQNGIEIVNI